MSIFKKSTASKFAIAGAVVVGAVGIWFGAPALLKDPTKSTGPAHVDKLVRVNTEQYRQIVKDLFGSNIEVKGRIIAPEKRDKGLLAVGAAELSMSSLAFESAESIANAVAAQIIDSENRYELLPCQADSESDFDAVCAETIIQTLGQLLYRRPLLERETQMLLETAKISAETQGGFYNGIERSLAQMLVSPNFLFRIEYAEPDPVESGEYRLTAYSKASRLSFLLWNSAPDALLLEAAANGSLHKEDVLEKEIERMLGSVKFENGVRAFFSDMLGLEKFNRLSKDSVFFPKFTSQVAKDAKEQTLMTLVDHLVFREADYRDLFVSRKTFLTPSLAALLSVPLVQDTANALPDRWVPFEYPANDPRAGLLAQPAFVALHSHAGRTSPTLRGKALREYLLCQEVPPPPPDVDFTLVMDMDNPELKTTRQRLNAHASVKTCAGCHKITDPIGLALENFDADGSFRTKEHGLEIDSSGELDGVTYDGPVGLGQALRDNRNVSSCLVNRMFSYGSSRVVEREDRTWLKSIGKGFAESGYTLPSLVRMLATNPNFYRGSPPSESATGVATNAQPDNSTNLIAQEAH